MVIKTYNVEIENATINKELKKLTNLIYKLLPLREDNMDWESPLKTILTELSGMNRLLVDQQNLLFPLLCKLEGLFLLTQFEDFYEFRRNIFECLGLINAINKNICQD